MSAKKSEQSPLDLINRRDLFMGASMLAMLGVQDAAMAGGHTAPRLELSEEQQAALIR